MGVIRPKRKKGVMASSRWYYAKGDQVFGPVDSTELKHLANSGEFGPNDRVRKDDMQQWVQAGVVKNLFMSVPTQKTSTRVAVRDVIATEPFTSAEVEHATNTIPIFGDESHLPESVAGLPFCGLTVHPDPRLGVMIGYGSPQIASATCYLYDMGVSDIPEDLQSPDVVQFFEEAVGSVSVAAEQGLYMDFEVLTTEYLHVPPYSVEPDSVESWLWAAFSYRENPETKPDARPGRQVSYLALRTDEGYINKVRFTADQGREPAAYVTFLRFLVSWRDAIAE